MGQIDESVDKASAGIGNILGTDRKTQEVHRNTSVKHASHGLQHQRPDWCKIGQGGRNEIQRHLEGERHRCQEDQETASALSRVAVHLLSGHPDTLGTATQHQLDENRVAGLVLQATMSLSVRDLMPIPWLVLLH